MKSTLSTLLCLSLTLSCVFAFTTKPISRKNNARLAVSMLDSNDRYHGPKSKPILDQINSPKDMKKLSIPELKQLAHELRWETLEIVSKTGGHLGSSLGVIELTVALHYIFNTPEDRIIFDVSHQVYPHKILTGRRSRMSTLRQKNGISGFAKRTESVYDCFGAGHSSTSISAALGMSVGKDMTGRKSTQNNCVAVIGDGAITGGMAFEAMNVAGYLKQRSLVILNDNGQVSLPTGTHSAGGIVPAGALSSYTGRLLSSKPFTSVRDVAKSLNKLFPESIQSVNKKIDEYARGMVSGGTLFEELGYYYVGPVDGHDLDNLIPILQNIRDMEDNKPVLLHIKTEKGMGYPPAMAASDKYHGVAKFDVTTGKQEKGPPSISPSYSSIMANSLIDIAANDKKVVAITAAMPGGTGLDLFGRRFPKQTFDVGIAEQHAVTFAAGMAVEGLKPFVCIYSTFLQRAYDQVVHDVSIQKLPVRFMVDRAGLVGSDGATHAGSFDLTYLGTLPNVIVMAPSDEIELKNMVQTSYEIEHLPSFVRYPRGGGYGIKVLNELMTLGLEAIPSKGSSLPIGKGRIIRKADKKSKQKVAILSIGTMLVTSIKAALKLEEERSDLGVTVADARFMKPLDKDLIRDLVGSHSALLTIEENSIGGFGGHVLQFLASDGLLDGGSCKVRNMMLPDEYVDAATPNEQHEMVGLNVDGVVEMVSGMLKKALTAKLSPAHLKKANILTN
mmetsp:Transcript_7600/g.11388  ORF Transcript_7600/g.11388 Transcript_7600/m.11388 type:complete len:729 (+) Transcript_7600:44-2230(+)|eukprot:CAMPEP_0171462756 /NCGR_PEP_ID=MMETSP0945-20130129/6661_1 /TAXON_ID=109269 /ORGANISM="Vaucheria litorea, Strain CCMP2940" /LENGTH=728 /DNA_ID=CAMNT_0011989335 /DNA_START=42 /DNA_END=2228 /DNA_ORIENTATION=+